MNLQCSASALLHVALDLQRGVEVRSEALQHLPYLNCYVSISSAFEGVEIQLFEGNTDSFDFPNEGLLYLLELLDVSIVYLMTRVLKHIPVSVALNFCRV